MTAIHADAYVEEALGWLPDNTMASIETGNDANVSQAVIQQIESARILLADDNADMRAYVRRLLGPNCECKQLRMDKQQSRRYAKGRPIW